MELGLCVGSSHPKTISILAKPPLSSLKVIVESGEVDSDRFGISFFFFLSITDRSEEINQYLKNVSTTLIDIKQEQLKVWHDSTPFGQSSLHSFGLNKRISSDAVKKCLVHLNIFNSNLVRNAEGNLLINWLGKEKVRTAPQKFKISY